MLKKTSVAGAFARKEEYSYEGKTYSADIQNGDTVTILNKGDIISGEFGEQYVFSIKTRNGDKNVALNQTSINALIDALGDESEQWAGAEVKVSTKKDTVAGKRAIIAYFHPTSYALNEWGDLEKVEHESSVDSPKKAGNTDVDYPEEYFAPTV